MYFHNWTVEIDGSKLNNLWL